MADLAVTARVISPSLPDFVISPANGYTIVRSGFGPGPKVWRRQTVQSPFSHGRTLVGVTLDVQNAVLGVRVRGSSMSQLATRILDLRAVLDRLAYTLEVTLDGVAFQWACECADSTPGDGGVFDDNGLRGRYQLMTFSIPRHPLPVAGVL